MKKKAKAWILIGIFILISVLDGVVTRIGTPDLAIEANPLVAIFGMSWAGLITGNIIVIIIYSVLTYYAHAVYSHPLVQADNPKDYRTKVEATDGWQSIVALIGYSLSYSMIIARIMPVLEWVGYIINKPSTFYARLRGITPFARPDLFVAGILTLISAGIWLYHHYKFKGKQDFMEGEIH